jgi:hypothetical protein
MSTSFELMEKEALMVPLLAGVHRVGLIARG